MVLKLLVELVLLVVVNLEPQESNTQVVTPAQLQQVRKIAKAEAVASVDFAEASAYPEFEDITKDVYFEVDEFTEAGRTGRHFFND